MCFLKFNGKIWNALIDYTEVMSLTNHTRLRMRDFPNSKFRRKQDSYATIAFCTIVYVALYNFHDKSTRVRILQQIWYILMVELFK